MSSATLTSYTTYSDGDSLDASLPNHLGLPVVNQKMSKRKSSTTLGNLAKEKKIMATIRNFLIVIALSVHSVFEGMAIGNWFTRLPLIYSNTTKNMQQHKIDPEI